MQPVYERIYGINPFEERFYDLVINNNNVSVDQEIEIILRRIAS